MTDQDYMDLKHLASRLYELSAKMWPTEFKKVFEATKQDFMVWMNDKTSSEENHIIDKKKALKTWVEKLEKLRV